MALLYNLLSMSLFHFYRRDRQREAPIERSIARAGRQGGAEVGN
jgi:hypothetical protein